MHNAMPQSPPRRPHFCPLAAFTHLLYWRLLDWVSRKSMASSSFGSYLRLVLPWRIAAWIWFIASKRERRWLWRQFLTMQPRPRIGEGWRRIRLPLVAVWRSSTFLACLKGLTLNFFKVFLLLPLFRRKKRGREEAAKYGLYHIVYTITAASAKEGLRFENAHTQLIIINLELQQFRTTFFSLLSGCVCRIFAIKL